MVSLIKNGFLLLAFGLVVASFAFAFTAQEEAAFFAREGETPSVSEFDGYQMISVNGIETAILKPSGDGFAVVQDDAGIQTAVEKYSSKAFEELKAVVPQVISGFNQTASIIDTCIFGSKYFAFNKSKTGIFATAYLIRIDRLHFPKEYSAVHYILDNVVAFEQDWKKAKAGLEALQTSLSDSESSLAAAANAREGLKPIKEKYPKYYEAYLNVTKVNFPQAYYYQGKNYGCAPDSNVTGKIDEVLGVIGANKFNPSSVLTETIKTRLQDRNEEATQNRVKSGASIQAGSIAEQATLMQELFAAFGVQLNALKTETENLQNAVGTAEFENQSQALSAKLSKYQAILAEYNSTSLQVSSAERALQNATQRFGANDDRIAELQKQLQEARISLKENENALSAGNLEVLNVSGILQNATAITLTAQALQPKENQFDLVTISAIVLLIALAAGGVYYFRKQRPPGGMSSYNPPSRPDVTLEDIRKI
ncbi:MAG: hypothetical protein V1717_02660 [Candidatus Micrarchaeota archaeon]